MALETIPLNAWLENRLKTDPTLSNLIDSRVFEGAVPVGETLPSVTFSFQAGTDNYALGPSRYGSTFVYLVKAVTQGESFVTLQAIVDRLDELLDGATGTLSTGDTVIWLRQSPVEYIEYEGGRQIRHLGAFWNVWVI